MEYNETSIDTTDIDPHHEMMNIEQEKLEIKKQKFLLQSKKLKVKQLELLIQNKQYISGPQQQGKNQVKACIEVALQEIYENIVGSFSKEQREQMNEIINIYDNQDEELKKLAEDCERKSAIGTW